MRAGLRPPRDGGGAGKRAGLRAPRDGGRS